MMAARMRKASFVAGNDGKPLLPSLTFGQSVTRRYAEQGKRQRGFVAVVPLTLPKGGFPSFPATKDACLCQTKIDTNPRSPNRPSKPLIGCSRRGFPLAGWNLRSDGEALHDEPTRPMSIPV